MDNYLLLAYLHIGQEASNTPIECEAFEVCIGEMLTKVSQQDFLQFIESKVKSHPTNSHFTGDMIAYLLAFSYSCSNPEDQDACIGLIEEVLVRQNFKTQRELEKSFKVKVWEIMKEMYPEKIKQYEDAQKSMLGKVLITVLKRKILRDQKFLAVPEDVKPKQQIPSRKWLNDFVEALQNHPRSVKLVWK